MNKKPNRAGRTEPNRVIPEAEGTGLGNEPNRTGPGHDASEKRRPNRVEPGQITVRTEPNRTEVFSKGPEQKGIEPNRHLAAFSQTPPHQAKLKHQNTSPAPVLLPSRTLKKPFWTCL